MRQIFPRDTAVSDRELAALYGHPGPPEPGGQWLRANMVTSLDGAASLNGRSGGLSCEADEQVFAMLRALADVILVGAGTARAEGYGPVRPESEGVRWSWLRQGRAPSPPIAVITRQLSLDPASPLLSQAPAHARTIVITTGSAPAARRAEVAEVADLVVAGETSVDPVAAVAALARRGHRQILTEGGPHLLGQLLGAGLLDELCLTVSPLLTGPGAGRIVQPMGPAGLPGQVKPQPFRLAHLLSAGDHLLARYVRGPVSPAAGPGRPPG